MAQNAGNQQRKSSTPSKTNSRWKSAEEIINAIKDEFFINIIPVKTEHLRTYARLRLNTQQDHKDPSDHVIISHAITEHLPLISSDTRFGYYRTQGLDFIHNQR